jgi:hypothetical protein
MTVIAMTTPRFDRDQDAKKHICQMRTRSLRCQACGIGKFYRRVKGRGINRVDPLIGRR